MVSYHPMYICVCLLYVHIYSVGLFVMFILMRRPNKKNIQTNYAQFDRFVINCLLLVATINGETFDQNQVQFDRKRTANTHITLYAFVFTLIDNYVNEFKIEFRLKRDTVAIFVGFGISCVNRIKFEQTVQKLSDNWLIIILFVQFSFRFTELDKINILWQRIQFWAK